MNIVSLKDLLIMEEKLKNGGPLFLSNGCNDRRTKTFLFS